MQGPSFIHTKLALPESHHNVKWRLRRLHYDVKMQLQGIFITIYGHHIYNIKSWWKVFQCFSGDEIIMSSWWHNEVSTNLHRPNCNVHCNGKYIDCHIRTIEKKKKSGQKLLELEQALKTMKLEMALKNILSKIFSTLSPSQVFFFFFPWCHHWTRLFWILCPWFQDTWAVPNFFPALVLHISHWVCPSSSPKLYYNFSSAIIKISM